MWAYRNILSSPMYPEEPYKGKFLQTGSAKQAEPVGEMESRTAAAAATAAVSQALVLLFSIPNIGGASAAADPAHLLLVLHLIACSDIAAAAAAATRQLLPPRNPKRRRLSPVVTPVAAPPISTRHQPDYFRLGLGVTASTFEWLSGLLEPLLDWPGAPRSIPAAAKLAVGLSHLVSGEPYRALAARLDLPAAAVRSCARRLRRVLCTNFRFWVAGGGDDSSPTPRLLPGCVGAVACARFPVAGAAQVLAGESCRILHIAAGFAGDEPSGRILRRSTLHRAVGPLGQYFLGGAEYPLLTWLIVPYEDGGAAAASPPAAMAFNSLHRRIMARTVHRTVASLMNWGILRSFNLEDEDPKAAAACVATCAILHNMLQSRDDFSSLAAPPPEEDEEEDGDRVSFTKDAADWPVDPVAATMRDDLAQRELSN